MNQLVIMSGGKGTRLKSLNSKLPKCLIKIKNKTLLEHQLLLAKKYKFKNILLLTGYKSSLINNFIKKKKLVNNIRIIKDKKNLGNGGALLNAKEYLEDEFCLIYCDILTDINLKKLVLFAKNKKTDLCLVVNKNSNFQDSNLITFGKNKIVKDIHIYPHKKIPKKCYSSEAIFVCKKNKLFLLKKNNNNKKIDFVKDLIPQLFSRIKIHGYKTSEYIIDCGTIDRLQNARLNFRSEFKK
jgi:ADP-glucose pyrophosphorylase